MPIQKIIDTQIPIKIWTKDIDDASIAQLKQVAQLPIVHHHIAVMADVHLGKGATIGSVIPTMKAVIPAAVGVDLGCGMMATQLTLQAQELPDKLRALRSAIEASVPHGRSHHGGPNDKGAWSTIPPAIEKMYAKMGLHVIDDLIKRHPKLISKQTNSKRHLGTLGTGNHFIELCLDEKDAVWILLHSGSRGVGNRIASHFIALAKKEMKALSIDLPQTDLAYLQEGSPHFKDYVRAVSWAQNFAKTNRTLMMQQTLNALSRTLGREILTNKTVIDCHHNYIAREHHFGEDVILTRKGAIRARKGDFGIIPGSMGTNSFIVRGRGNASSFESCAHGAGRVMSRTAARKRFTAKDLARQTQGIECPKDESRVDEIPAAYKSIDTVMKNQRDLVEVVHTLRQILNVKG